MQRSREIDFVGEPFRVADETLVTSANSHTLDSDHNVFWKDVPEEPQTESAQKIAECADVCYRDRVIHSANGANTISHSDVRLEGSAKSFQLSVFQTAGKILQVKEGTCEQKC